MKLFGQIVQNTSVIFRSLRGVPSTPRPLILRGALFNVLLKHEERFAIIAILELIADDRGAANLKLI